MSAWGDFLKARLAMIDEFDREGKTPEQIRFLLSMDLMQTVLLIMTARQHRADTPTPGDREP